MQVQIGLDDSRKGNVTTIISRVKGWLSYMAHGCSGLDKWLFINNKCRIRR